MKIHVLIADDHCIVLDGLSTLLAGDNDIEVLAIASNGRDVVKCAVTLQPDVVIMDVSMPELNGVDATREITTKLPHTYVIALSMYKDRRFVNGMIDAGARGYLLKDCVSEELITAIKMVYKGQVYFSPDVTSIVVGHITGDTKPSSPFDTLTCRERETLQLIAEGYPTKVIAKKIDVSTKTVETYRKRIAEKLNAHSIADLTRIALREKLISF